MKPLDNELRHHSQRGLPKLKKTKRERKQRGKFTQEHRVVLLQARVIKRLQPRLQSTEHLGHPQEEESANIALAGR